MHANRAGSDGNPSRPIARRTLLRAGGAGLVGGLAGCLGGDDCPDPSPGADLSGCTLDEEDLSGVDLSGADLSDASLQGADLRGVDLSGANLDDALLQEATLDDADLTEATLEEAVLSGVSADAATFSNAALVGTVIDGATFVESDFEGADLTEIWGVEDDWELVNSAAPRPDRYADFTEAAMSSCTLDDGYLPGVEMQGAILDDASAVDATFFRGVLADVTARDTDFRGADLRGVDDEGAAFVGSNFEGSFYLSYGSCSDETCGGVAWDPDEAAE